MPIAVSYGEPLPDTGTVQRADAIFQPMWVCGSESRGLRSLHNLSADLCLLDTTKPEVMG